MRKIYDYGPVDDNGQGRMRNSEEFKMLFNNPDIVSVIKSNRLRWLKGEQLKNIYRETRRKKTERTTQGWMTSGRRISGRWK